MKNIYIHIPFCNGKCAYCSLYSVPYSDSMADSYLECLTREFEISGAGSGAGPDTVYIGGGTPTVLTENRLQRLMEIVLSAISGKTPAEWSVEVSPDTLSRKKLDILMSAGVNRVSMGAQSFDEQALIAMGRRHNRKQIFDGIETMRKNGMENIGVDLIASIPGVTDKSWRENLNICASLKIPHISVYSLTIEEGTVLRDRIDNGSLAVKNERDQLDDLSAAESILTLVGYRRYEISNYSLPGYECGHNMACWRGDDYAGFGPGASGREGLARWTNVPDLKKYIDAIFSGGGEGARVTEILSPRDDIRERMLFGFRMKEGVDMEKFSGIGEEVMSEWKSVLERMANEQLVEKKGARWRLTARGRQLADTVLENLA